LLKSYQRIGAARATPPAQTARASQNTKRRRRACTGIDRLSTPDSSLIRPRALGVYSICSERRDRAHRRVHAAVSGEPGTVPGSWVTQQSAYMGDSFLPLGPSSEVPRCRGAAHLPWTRKYDSSPTTRVEAEVIRPRPRRRSEASRHLRV